MPGHEMSTEEMVRDLFTRFTRVERAIMGDPSVGHRGLVTRVEALEEMGKDAPSVHQDIDSRRIEGDRRLHERVDAHEDKTKESIIRIEKKIDKVIWVFAGAFLGGLGTGGSVVWAILG